MLPAVFRLFSLILATIYTTISEPVTSTPDLCTDKSPYCNLNDCAVRPGYSLQFCRRTCGQCGEFCQESIYVSCKEERKDECEQMLKDYCPMLCGLCTLANQTTKKISKQTKPMKYKIFDKGLSTPLQSTTSTASYSKPNIDQSGVDGSTKVPLNPEISQTTLVFPVSKKIPKKKTKKTSKKPISTPILPSETTTRFISPPISIQTTPLNFARPERKLLTSTAINQPTSDDPMIWEEQETSTLNNQDEMAWVHPTRVFPQIQAEIDRNEEAISDWATDELMNGPTPHIVPFNPYFVPMNAKLGFGDTSQWSNGLFSDDGEKEEHLPQPIPLNKYRPLQPQPIIFDSTPPNWTFLPMPKRIAARKQATFVKIPKPRPLTINAVDMNLLESEEEQMTEPTMVPTFTPSLNQAGPEWRFSGVVPPYRFPDQENYLGNTQDDAYTATQIDGPVNSMLRKRIISQPTEDENDFYHSPSRSVHRKYTSSPFVHVTESPSISSIEVNPMKLTDLITLLGCRDRDPTTCSQISEDTCHSRPGYYLKLCPVKCRNCNGLLCYDSIKIDCAEVKKRGGCKLPLASEYCPKTCNLCPHTPAFMEGLSPCKDELDTCEPLATTGVCDHPYSQSALRIYCAKSCGFCKEPQYYMNEPRPIKEKKKNQQRTKTKRTKDPKMR